MKIIENPNINEWKDLTKRSLDSDIAVMERVKNILSSVRTGGDTALIRFAKEFDGRMHSPDTIQVSIPRRQVLSTFVTQETLQALQTAKRNIKLFHSKQGLVPYETSTSTGITCSRKVYPLDTVGLYIPGGRAPLCSTVLMLAIPAILAKVPNIYVCTPELHPAVAAACRVCGIDRIFEIGGAQAIGAMAYGTATIPKADKIFGPGNRFVTFAKQLVAKEGVAIDMPAGPSEVLVIADHPTKPAWVAADLLSQAEHGPDSLAVLVTSSKGYAEAVSAEFFAQLVKLPRKDAISVDRCFSIVFEQKEGARDFAQYFAPEHLIISGWEEDYFLENISNAGSVFVGPYTPEVLGDYASGTNHTLPTSGFSRSWSGVTVESFQRSVTVQRASKEGFERIASTVTTLAKVEGLDAHANAVSIRLRG